MPMTLAAASVLLVGIAALLPGWYRESWIWENPAQAAIGATLAVTASAGSVAVAVAASRQRVKHTKAVAAGFALLVVVILGGLLFMRSGANVIPVFITP
jgi:NADH:ubiquinone oxidoreductase subunit 2 (subunit N)